jgi:hypothetical protein
MVGENSKAAGFKRKAEHELKQFVEVFLYLAFFFCAIATYRMILLNELPDSYFYYSAAMLNALVIAKVILAGEYVHLGKKYDGKPLFLSVLYKAFLFSLLVFGFHHVEEVIKRLLRGQNAAGEFHDVRTDELLGRGIVIFCTFISFFALGE